MQHARFDLVPLARPRPNLGADIVAFGLSDDNGAPLLAIGDAKWNDVMGLRHLERLRRIRILLAGQGRANAAQAQLACYSGAGFTDPLRRIDAESDDVVLVDLQQLYRR